MDDEGESKSAQAYQVLGQLLLAPEADINDEETERALNYFSDSGRYSEDFLPWPRVDGRSQVGKDIITGMKQALEHADQTNTVEVFAEEWARIEGKLDRYLDDKAGKLTPNDGTFQGYNVEARQLLERVEARGLMLVRTE